MPFDATPDLTILLKRDLQHEVTTTLAAFVSDNDDGLSDRTLADITATILAGRDYEGHGARRHSGFLIRPKLLPEAVLATFAGADAECSRGKAERIADMVNESGGLRQACETTVFADRCTMLEYREHLRNAARAGQRVAA